MAYSLRIRMYIIESNLTSIDLTFETVKYALNGMFLKLFFDCIKSNANKKLKYSTHNYVKS